MRVLAFLLLSVHLVPINFFAQTAGSGEVAPSWQRAQFQYEDGGVTEILQSIFIPPRAQAPFSLTLHTEWVKSLSDGNTITHVNQRHISRDSQGRIFQERCNLVPKNGKLESREYWYSPELGINLLSTRSDPRIGKQIFRASDLVLSEPDQ